MYNHCECNWSVQQHGLAGLKAVPNSLDATPNVFISPASQSPSDCKVFQRPTYLSISRLYCSTEKQSLKRRSLNPSIFNMEEMLARTGNHFMGPTVRILHLMGQVLSTRNPGNWTAGPREDENMGVAKHWPSSLLVRALEQSVDHQVLPGLSSS